MFPFFRIKDVLTSRGRSGGRYYNIPFSRSSQCNFRIRNPSAADPRLKELPTSSATWAVSGVEPPPRGNHLGQPITSPKCLSGTREDDQEMALLRPISIVPTLFTSIIMISQAQAKYPCHVLWNAYFAIVEHILLYCRIDIHPLPGRTSQTQTNKIHIC